MFTTPTSKVFITDTIKDTQCCSVNIHSFHVHCCSVCFSPVGHRIHFSSRLTLSVEFSRFRVGPVRTTVYTSTLNSQNFIPSSCSVSVSFKLSFFTCLFIPVSSRSVPQALLSFYCYLSLFWRKLSFCLYSQLVSLTAPALVSSSHKFNFCCYASTCENTLP